MREQETARRVEEFSFKVFIASMSVIVGAIAQALGPEAGSLAVLVAGIFGVSSGVSKAMAGGIRKAREKQ